MVDGRGQVVEVQELRGPIGAARPAGPHADQGDSASQAADSAATVTVGRSTGRGRLGMVQAPFGHQPLDLGPPDRVAVGRVGAQRRLLGERHRVGGPGPVDHGRSTAPPGDRPRRGRLQALAQRGPDRAGAARRDRARRRSPRCTSMSAAPSAAPDTPRIGGRVQVDDPVTRRVGLAGPPPPGRPAGWRCRPPPPPGRRRDRRNGLTRGPSGHDARLPPSRARIAPGGRGGTASVTRLP